MLPESFIKNMTKTTKRVFLVGFMASGKTTLGKKIANSLNLDFFDFDNYITTKIDKSISDIFYNEGEDFFRTCEANLLEDFFNKDNYVLSTGGGTPCFFNNMQKLKNNGITVFVNTPLYIIISRLLNGKGKRPLIENLPATQVPDFVKSLYSQRIPYYEKSNIFYNPVIDDFNKLIDEIKNQFSKVS